VQGKLQIAGSGPTLLRDSGLDFQAAAWRAAARLVARQRSRLSGSGLAGSGPACNETAVPAILCRRRPGGQRPDLIRDSGLGHSVQAAAWRAAARLINGTAVPAILCRRQPGGPARLINGTAVPAILCRRQPGGQRPDLLRDSGPGHSVQAEAWRAAARLCTRQRSRSFCAGDSLAGSGPTY
jgi:hypothetical protein